MNDHDGTYILDRSTVTITNAQTRLFITYHISECTASFVKIKDKGMMSTLNDRSIIREIGKYKVKR